MNDIILAQANETVTAFDGLQSIGYGIATIGPGLGIGIRTPLGLPDTLAPITSDRLPVIGRSVHLAAYRAAGPASAAARALLEIAQSTLKDGRHL